MKAYKCSQNDLILLLGEGNFSFTVDLITFNSFKSSNNVNIISSCFEENDPSCSSVKGNNIKLLKEKGVQVLLGVDATKLKDHPVLKYEIFTKIIFNFPHVGGKMKIHLNRQLLSDFFMSACDVLADNGEVVVALCSGQGGTGAELKVRRWDDTWQIVEMAAHADLALTLVEPFPVESFPGYTSVGYRSRECSFNNLNSLVHVFAQILPNQLVFNEDGFKQEFEIGTLETPYGILGCAKLFINKILNNPFERKGSAQWFLFKILQDSTIVTGNCTTCIEESSLSYTSESSNGVHCTLNGVKTNLRHSLFEVIPNDIFGYDVVIFNGLVFNKLSDDFANSPVRTQILIHGVKCLEATLEYINRLLHTFQLSNSMLNCIYDNEKESRITAIDLIVGKKQYAIVESQFSEGKIVSYLIHLDFLAVLLFKLDCWRELWPKTSRVEMDDGHPVFRSASLYCPIYEFDICFAVSVLYNESRFYDILWYLAGEIIQTVKLLNVYQPLNGKPCYCYRIVYKSYEQPLYRSRVINIHENIIGKYLEALINVSVA